MKGENIVVIGAGLGGLAAALRLQAAGRQTTLVDRNSTAGGKLNIECAGRYRFDTGPSLVTMPEVFDELFATVGLDFRRDVKLVPLAPYCRYFFDDGTEFDTSDSMSGMSQTLLRLAPDDADAFFTFMARAAKWYRMSAESVIYGPPMDWKGMKGSKFDPLTFFRMRPFESLERFIARTFHDERIRRIARLIALYTGCSPHRAPAIFTLIAFLEFGLGRWYIEGGLYRIVELLLARYRELGGDYRPSTSIERVTFEGGRARAAITDRGESIEGAHFVVNADVALAAKTFLRDAPGAARLNARLEKLRPSTSAFVLMIGTRADCSRLIHHNLLFSRDEDREWKEVFEDGVPPSEPTIYLNNPSYTDATLAPGGSAALFAMVNVPADDAAKWNWESRADEYQDIVLQRIDKLVPKIRDSIDVILRRTPPEFRDRTFADRGSIYGRAPDSLRAMMMRPRNEERGFEGILFAGGTTHPGAGIPLAALSGKLVGNLLLERRSG